MSISSNFHAVASSSKSLSYAYKAKANALMDEFIEMVEESQLTGKELRKINLKAAQLFDDWKFYSTQADKQKTAWEKAKKLW